MKIQIANPLVDSFLLGSAITALMYSVGEFFSYHRTRKQTLLGIVFFFTAYILFQFYLLSTRLILEVPFFYLSEAVAVTLLGAFLDEYLLSVTSGSVRSFRRLGLKLIPSSILLLSLVAWKVYQKEIRIEYLPEGLADRPRMFVSISLLVYFFFLIKAFLRLVQQFSWQSLKQSTTIKIGLIIILFCLLEAFNAICILIRGAQIDYRMTGFTIGTFLIILYILRQAFPDFFLEVRKIVAEEKKAKISQIGKLDLKELRKQLEKLYRDEKIYQEEKLSLREIADRLDLSTHQISEFLNTEMKMSFYQYTNQYRIEEAKRLIQKEPDRSFLAIAYDVGFGSKSSFNEAFKKITGLSPREFRERQL
ncbi:DNA-binding helix-turn-helix protein [Leptospira ryugenii]|uniref:DNA-binding helix-turn-helix protein n=1 Tax=Leptospira ryugenii TaxID=1917863 RepID=A0A2P2E401_9LEPT|nr:helix-turn-helix domain-containing protein [Leptospira ryugenii]GBF51610.1 DNA-binding helix-turn-helix protein [Leptospira ryugenii]